MISYLISMATMFSAVPWRIVTEETEDSCYCHIEKGLLTSVKSRKNINFQKVSSNESEDWKEIQTSLPGQLEELLGEHINTVDSLVIEGPIDSSDLYVMWKSSFYGKLKVINLENASIENETIPDYAFWHQDEQLEPSGEYIDCISLKRIILPDDIKSIGENAFSYAINLEYINLPSSLRFIGEAAFSDCISLKVDPLIFPEGVEKINDFLFVNCKELKGTVILPSTIKEIGEGAFFQAKISSINFPEGLNKIGNGAFYACRLKEAQLPESCQNLSASCIFQLNLELESIHLPDGIESIPHGFANACLKLSDVNIPSSVRNIEDYAFWQCRSLKNLELPSTLESIGKVGLWYLDSLETIVFPSTLKLVGAESCSYWANIKQIYCTAINPPVCENSNTNPGNTPFGAYGSTFDMRTPQDTPIYVPVGSADLYRQTWGWDYFTNFIETDDFPSAGIDSVAIDIKENDSNYYDLLGRKVESPASGNIYIRNGKKFIER